MGLSFFFDVREGEHATSSRAASAANELTGDRSKQNANATKTKLTRVATNKPSASALVADGMEYRRYAPSRGLQRNSAYSHFPF